jgi:hypothetical protein
MSRLPLVPLYIQVQTTDAATTLRTNAGKEAQRTALQTDQLQRQVPIPRALRR